MNEDINKIILMVSRSRGKHEMGVHPAHVCCYIWEVEN